MVLMKIRSWGKAWIAALALAALPAAAEEAFTIERGDVLYVSVLEEPQLSREARVNADGRIMLAQIGGIIAAGRDVDGIRAQIEQELINRGIILTPTVLVEVASYRPFYVGGSVARPGAIPYEPGLTARHAIVLAGGLDRAGQAISSLSDLQELRNKLQASSYELLQTEALIARLSAELERAAPADLAQPDRRFVSPATAQEILALEKALLDDRLTEWNEGQSHLETALRLVDVELDVLAQQAGLQRNEQALQEEALSRARQLAHQGLMPLPRLQELEREASRLSRDLLDNLTYDARARQNRAALEHELSAADTNWRVEVQKDLRTAMLARTRLQADVDNLGSRLFEAGMMMDKDGNLVPPVPDLLIHRNGQDSPLQAAMDTEILPGDVIEVTLAPPPAG